MPKFNSNVNKDHYIQLNHLLVLALKFNGTSFKSQIKSNGKYWISNWKILLILRNQWNLCLEQIISWLNVPYN